MLLKERIVEQTSRMFLTEGIRSIRMDDIAAKLGISKRTLYEQFTDKETLILSCINYYHQLQLKRQREITSSAQNVMEAFISMLREWDKNAEANYHIMSSLKKFYPKIYEKLSQENYKEEHERLKKSLETGVQQGLFLDNINIDLAISVFSYSLYGLLLREEAIRPHNVSHSDAFKYIITYFFRGIATEKGIKLLDGYLTKTNIIEQK